MEPWARPRMVVGANPDGERARRAGRSSISRRCAARRNKATKTLWRPRRGAVARDRRAPRGLMPSLVLGDKGTLLSGRDFPHVTIDQNRFLWVPKICSMGPGKDFVLDGLKRAESSDGPVVPLSGRSPNRERSVKVQLMGCGSCSRTHT